jgi:hypothetical protein
MQVEPRVVARSRMVREIAAGRRATPGFKGRVMVLGPGRDSPSFVQAFGLNTCLPSPSCNAVIWTQAKRGKAP